jgi:Glutathione S-transferase, N-terminal domain
MLEETGLNYKVVPIDTGKGEQHAPDFRAINPNGKVPAIVDPEGPAGEEVRVFDSSAILLYLGEKTGRFLGSPVKRPELLSDDADPLAAFLNVDALVSNRRRRPAVSRARIVGKDHVFNEEWTMKRGVHFSCRMSATSEMTF